MPRDACGDRFPERFLDVGGATLRSQDRIPDRDGAATGAAVISRRAVFAAPGQIVPGVLRLAAADQVLPVLAAVSSQSCRTTPRCYDPPPATAAAQIGTFCASPASRIRNLHIAPIRQLLRPAAQRAGQANHAPRQAACVWKQLMAARSVTH
jgi:hypothetical protein